MGIFRSFSSSLFGYRLTAPLTQPIASPPTPDKPRRVVVASSANVAHDPTRPTSTRAEAAFWAAYFVENPARATQEILPTTRASASNPFIPHFISAASLYDLLDEMVDKDTVIGGTETTVANQVLAREWRIEAPEGVDAEAAAPLVDFVRRSIAGLGSTWTEAVRCLILGARRHGFAVAETVYRLERGQLVPDRIRHCYPGAFDFSLDGRLLLNAGGTDPVEVDRERFIVHRNGTMYGNPYGQSEVYPLRWPFYFKRCALRSWADGVETYGLPIMVGTVDDTAEGRNRQAELETIFSLLRSSSGVTVPNGVKIEAIPRGLTASNTPHKDLIEYLDRAMVRALTGSTLSTMESGDTGSLAQSKTHGQIANDKLVAVCNSLGETLTRDFIAPLIRINFGPTAPVPRYVIDTDEEEDIYPALAIVSKAAEMGVPMSTAQFREWFGLAPPKDADDEMRPLVVGSAPVDSTGALGGGGGALGPSFSFGPPGHPSGCKCGCGTGERRPFFFAQTTPPLTPSRPKGRRVRI